jgi:hypothetical protein
VLSLAVVGCVAPPKNVGQESDTDAAGNDGTGSGESTDTPGETGEPAACGEIVDGTTCNATLDCAWVEITTIIGSGDFCGFEQPRNHCIRTFYQGDGCVLSPACGDEGAGVAYWAARPEVGPDAFEIITPADFCSDQPVDYQPCRWSADGTQLESGPEACGCICGGGGGPAFPPGIEGELTEQAGCADVTAYAYNPEQSVALSFSVDAGYAMQATDTQAPVDVELTAGGDVEVRLWLGSELASRFCTDVGGVGEVDASWTATAGSISLHVEPGDPYPFASLTLTNVAFESDDGSNDPYTLDSYTFTDVMVGWLPG